MSTPGAASPIASGAAWSALLLAMSAACSDGRPSSPSVDGGGAASDAGDGSADGSERRDAASTSDAEGDVCATWTPAVPFEPCNIPPAMRGGPLVLDRPGAYRYDTDEGLLQDATGAAVDHSTMVIDGVRLVSAEIIRVESGVTLRAAGALPLLLVSWSSIEVGQGASGVATIDVSSHSQRGPGAGADPSACGAGAGGEGGAELSGGGGGGGGGFGASGGR